MKAGASDRVALDDHVHTALARAAQVSDLLTLRGHVKVELFDKDGKLKETREVANLITTVGRNQIVEQLLASPAASTKPTHMEVGTSSTAETVGDTTITGAFGRVALTTKTRATNVLTMVGDWAAGASTGSLREAGVWDASTAGNLLARATFALLTKGASDTLKITWTWTIG